LVREVNHDQAERGAALARKREQVGEPDLDGRSDQVIAARKLNQAVVGLPDGVTEGGSVIHPAIPLRTIVLDAAHRLDDSMGLPSEEGLSWKPTYSAITDRVNGNYFFPTT
jgi:hypothetical protein